jgi:molybdopterin converting factor small subunit
MRSPSSSHSHSHSASASNSDSDSDLPFPEPLPRTAFLSPTFDAATLLATLTSRHQTLADLRTELSSRSASIAAELLQLVNDEYQSFLGLGRELRGGDERVEEVRVGVLGFRKGVEAVRDVVRAREAEVARLVAEREAVRSEIGRGRALVAVGERVEELEEELALKGRGREDEDEENVVVVVEEEWVDEEETDDEEDEGKTSLLSMKRLKRLVALFVSTQNQIGQLGGADHPYLAKIIQRTQKIRHTLLLDLGSALKQARSAGKSAHGRVVKLLGLYSDLDASIEALQVIKEVQRPS